MKFDSSKREECNYVNILGTWASCYSEIPDFDDEVCTFTEDLEFIYEIYNSNGPFAKQNYSFRLMGCRLEYSKDFSCSTLIWIEDALLVMQPDHGCKTAFRREANFG